MKQTKLPEEFKGKEAVPFIEFVSELMNYLRESGNTERFKELMDESLDFYNQPFSVDMLVNPIELGKYSGVFKSFSTGVIMGAVIDEKDIELFHKWQQAESLRLFYGWVKHSDTEFEYDSIDVELADDILWFTHIDHTIAVGCAETLNDFITLCNLVGINLKWKE